MDTLKTFSKFMTQKRYIVACFLSFGITLFASVTATFSVAVVSMDKEFGWSSQQKGVVLSALSYGFVITQIPGGLISRKVAPNHVFGIGVVGACILTWITPWIAQCFYLLIAFKVLEGLLLGVTFPAMICLVNNWAPPLERSRIILIALAGNYFGPVISMPLAGVLSEHFGWKSVFYCLGFIGLIWFILFTIFVKPCPSKDTKMKSSEFQYITKCISNHQGQCDTQFKIPWLSIFTSIPFWGIVIANLTLSWGAYTLATQMPTYLNDMNPDIEMSLNGFYSMFPALMTGLLSPLAGYLADLAQETKFLTTIQVRKVFTCISFLIQSVFMLLSSLLITNMHASITLLSVGEGLAAFALCGYGVNCLDIAPNFSGVLVGISTTIGTLAGIASPLLTGFIVRNSEKHEWQRIFFITAGIYLIGAVTYYLTASGDIQKWAKVTDMGHEISEKSKIFIKSESESTNST